MAVCPHNPRGYFRKVGGFVYFWGRDSRLARTLAAMIQFHHGTAGDGDDRKGWGAVLGALGAAFLRLSLTNRVLLAF